MDADLKKRLVEAGVDPALIADPEEAWLRLHDRFGLRATLVDRYALEAEHRGMTPLELSEEDRRRLARRVLEVHYPGMELIGPTGGDPIHVVPYDIQWPALFASWQKALTAGLGETAVRVDHIGSTAVPGLTAKPVIDIQLSVPDVEAEDGYVAGLESLGVSLRMREPGHRYFRPPPGEPRIVQIHVCAAGSDWERAHLLFRDYLRSHPGARDAYRTLKLELADRYRNDRIAYNEAKTGFILDTLELAGRWAAETGWALVALVPIDENNVGDVFDLEVKPEQREFVAPNPWSLAQALAESAIAWPRAIVADGEVVGFLMLEIDPEEEDQRPFWLWRLMIGAAHQGKGYGLQALQAGCDEVRRRGGDRIWTSWVEGEGGPGPFYLQFGFVPNGEIQDGEVVASLEL